MTQFEFLMTFASVILAIALTEMLGGWGKLIRSGLPTRWSGLWIGWSLVIVAIIIMYWSGLWPYRDQSFREGYKVFWLAIPTFFLVVLGYLLSPERLDGADNVDLERRYWQISPRMFPLLAMFLVCAALADWIIVGELRYPNASQGSEIVSRILQISTFSLLVAAGFTAKPWLHWMALAFLSIAPIRFLFGDFAIFQ
jgi:hypothetical protein